MSAEPILDASSSRKRQLEHHDHESYTDISNLPDLPKLNGELMLEVFTHKSLQGDRDLSDLEFGDSERLAELGRTVLESAVTHALFKRKPLLSTEQIRSERERILSDTTLNRWIIAYRLREKVRCSPALYSTLATPEESRLLFNAYTGAAVIENGLKSTYQWIGALADPTTPSALSPMPGEHSFKKVKIEQTSMALAKGPQYLPKFNEIAHRRGMRVDYPATFSGPPHAGVWTVQCVVDGIPKGIGKGSNKGIAKEDAAKGAFHALGWAPLMTRI